MPGSVSGAPVAVCPALCSRSLITSFCFGPPLHPAATATASAAAIPFLIAPSRLNGRSQPTCALARQEPRTTPQDTAVGPVDVLASASVRGSRRHPRPERERPAASSGRAPRWWLLLRCCVAGRRRDHAAERADHVVLRRRALEDEDHA